MPLAGSPHAGTSKTDLGFCDSFERKGNVTYRPLQRALYILPWFVLLGGCKTSTDSITSFLPLTKVEVVNVGVRSHLIHTYAIVGSGNNQVTYLPDTTLLAGDSFSVRYRHDSLVSGSAVTKLEFSPAPAQFVDVFVDGQSDTTLRLLVGEQSPVLHQKACFTAACRAITFSLVLSPSATPPGEVVVEARGDRWALWNDGCFVGENSVRSLADSVTVTAQAFTTYPSPATTLSVTSQLTAQLDSVQAVYSVPPGPLTYWTLSPSASCPP